MSRLITLVYFTEGEASEVDLSVDLDLLDAQRAVVRSIVDSQAVLPDVRETMEGVLNFLDAISDLAPPPLGREKAEYPDDDQCQTCYRWFRRGELAPAPTNKKYLMPTGKELRGKCPVCYVDIYS